MRETLFNWLGQTLYGRTCLDLFAGSGALGFEAASRGAEQVVMVEKNVAVFRALQTNVQKLSATQIFVHHQDGLEFIARDTQRYDVIFLDPPFQSDYLSKLWPLLSSRLNAQGRLYIEAGNEIEIPAPWQTIKTAKAGQVHYQLLALDNTGILA